MSQSITWSVCRGRCLWNSSGYFPIGGIQHGDDFHVFYSETEVGPVTRKLYDELTGIQFGDVEAPEGWIVKSGLKDMK